MVSIEKGFTSADLEALPDIPGVRYEIIDGDLFASSLTGRRFTTRDLKRFPDFPGVRFEIIDGQLCVARSPQWRHQYACSQLCAALSVWNQQSGKGLAITAPGLVFSPDNNVGPDVVWISRERLAESEDRHGHFRLAPEIVVEALSPGARNIARDREMKMRLYSRQRVQEYWIVDWQSRLVEIYGLDHGELRLVRTVRDGEMLTTPLLPGLSCAVSTLWDVPSSS